MALEPIQRLERISTPSQGISSIDGGGAPAGFEVLVGQFLNGVNAADATSTQAVQDLVSGQADDLHTAALAIAQSDLSFRLALGVRNRLLEAYQEVIRMQV